MSEQNIDVGMEVDGKAVTSAFDIIDKRIAAVQKHVTEIQTRSKAAAEAFRGQIQIQLKQINQVVGLLDRFEKLANKPLQDRRRQEDVAYKDNDRQLAATRKRTAEEQRMWEAQQRERQAFHNSQEQMAERRLAVANAREMRLAREADAERTRITQVGEQNRLKIRRDGIQEEIRTARSLSELDQQRLIAAERLTRARGMLGQLGADEDRQLLQVIALEKERLGLAERRILAEKAITDRVSRSDASIDGRLSVRSGRIDEKQFLSGLDTTAARTRVAEIEGRIAQQTERAVALTGQEKIEAEALLKVDDARLLVAKARVRQLEQQEAAAARAARAQARQDELANQPKRGPANSLGQILTPGYAAGAIARTALYGAAAMGTFAVYNAMQSAATGTIEFDDKLKGLQAIANATDTQMVQLAASIKDVGANSRFSLSELADIAKSLAQAGVSADGMKEALSAVSRLATASGSTPDEAVNLITAALGSFQLQGSEAARVADLMTTALNRTRLTVQQAAQAIQYVGATAYEQNITLEQLLATTAAISQAGVKSGSTAGTGMRQFLVDLQTPSKKLTEQLQALHLTQGDVDVSTRGLSAVLETLKNAGFDAAQAYSGLETRAAAWFLIAKNNLPLIDQLQLAMADQGAVATANDRAMNSLAAQWQRFKNLALEDFSDSASIMLNVVKNTLEKISNLMDKARGMAAGGGSGSPEDDWVTKQFFATLDRIDKFSGKTDGHYGSSFLARDLPLGTWLQSLGRDAKDATGHMEELQTAANRTTDEVSKQTDKVGALDKEILRLNTQKADLVGHEQRVNAETVSLMSRFEGLSQYVMGATGNINDLIGALNKLRGQEAGLLVDKLQAQASAFYQQQVDAKSSRMSAVSDIRQDSGLMDKLGPRGRAALGQLGSDTNGRAAAAILLDAAKELGKINANWETLLVRAGGNRQSEFSFGNQRDLSVSLARNADQSRSVFGQQFEAHYANLDGLLPRLRDARGSARQALENDMLRDVNEMEATATRLLATPNLRASSKPYLDEAVARAKSMKQQIMAAVAPTKEDEKAAKKAANEISFVSPVNGTPIVNSGFGSRSAPGPGASSNHKGVDIRGKVGDPVYATAEGTVTFAGPRGGYGNLIIIDHGAGTETRYAHLSRLGVKAGDPVGQGDRIGAIGATGNATGPNLHYERRTRGGIDPHPLSGTARGDPGKASDKAARLQHQAEEKARREQERRDREEAATQRFALGTAERVLNKSLKDLKLDTTDELFQAGSKTANDALEAWADQLRKATQADLKKSRATPHEVLERMQEVEDRIQQKREEVQSTIFDLFEKSIDAAIQAADKVAKKALAVSDKALSHAQGQLQGLSYQSLKGQVPDFVQQLAQRRVGYAEETHAKAQSEFLGKQISTREQQIERQTAKINSGSLNPGEMEVARQKLEELTLQVEELKNQKGQLDAALGAKGLLPTTWREGLDQAVDAFREANGLNLTFTQQLMNDFTPALQAGQSAIEGFFTDLTSGTTSVIGAFRNMASAVIKALQQMLVKMIAVKIMQMALNSFSGGWGPSDAVAAFNPVGPGMNGVNIGGGWFHGGQVHAYTGRYITDGVSNRDSVDAKIAKGEYVVRKSSVDSVGVDFMHRLNEQGSRALVGIQPRLIMPAAPKQEMKVFVVAPEHTPTMGPNDVLVTIANDIANGGQTKQLIKHVAQGG